MLDAKVELDGRLRAVINEFTREVAAGMTASVSSNAAAATAVGGGKRNDGFDAGEAAKNVRVATEKETRQLRMKLDEYLEDARTKETLVGAVQDQVVENYEDWYEGYMAQMRANGKVASKKGKGREDEVWDPDAFAAWSEDVFKVGRMLMRDSEDEDESRSISST